MASPCTMLDDSSESDLSSVPPSPPAEYTSPLDTPSSPLSTLSSSPEPPDYFESDTGELYASMGRKQAAHVVIPPYPSPPASQNTSVNGSPTPDGAESGVEGPPPAKRRKVSKEPKERSTHWLDLRPSEISEDDREHLDRVLSALHRRQKIVVIAGAGMSRSAGVPDFRSKQGLFSTLKKEHNLKGSGQHLFDASVYKDDASTEQFHSMISRMSRLTRDAKPTPFHHMLATIAKEGRLMRLYSQNVDCLETNMEPLQTRVPLTKDEKGKWPRTVQLHGGLDKMVCTKCHQISELNADLFDGSDAPLCQSCSEINDLRTTFQGKRSHGIGRLRPRMVLYHEQGPDEAAIGAVSVEDLRRRPDAVVVVGTTLKVKGLQRLVKEMCGVVRNRKDGGLAIWINPDPPPAAMGFRDCFDIIVQGTCDEVANRAAMRRWDEPADDFSVVSDEEEAKAASKRAAVVLPAARCTLEHAGHEPLQSAAHINNSFRPPPADGTPVLDPESKRPLDWSPISSRRASTQILPSIETEAAAAENVDVIQMPPTPSRSKHNTPTKTCAEIHKPLTAILNTSAFSQLKSSGAKSKKAAPKSSKSISTSKKIAANTLKGVKSKKASQQQKPVGQAINKSFGQSKSASTAARNAGEKLEKTPAAASSPSKLRHVMDISSMVEGDPEGRGSAKRKHVEA